MSSFQTHGKIKVSNIVKNVGNAFRNNLEQTIATDLIKELPDMETKVSLSLQRPMNIKLILKFSNAVRNDNTIPHSHLGFELRKLFPNLI
jgi:hypothetical protein